ncbi:hypothetical protein, conserved [Eimeria necatrix]|uniref:Uncharacterized protein n=1 Tax=Eimeria necatrix TaxID=51315 RepID=U6MLL1_9EIME|nr:hypothetical protein, conserved [Eimeria necatrix]CDJ64911.1 hypothetical protein, conserved [Eimeria necatrix]
MRWWLWGRDLIPNYISDRELRRLQLPSLLAALLPPAASLEDQGGSGSSTANSLPVQQQALVIRGAASLVLQQWLLLATEAALLLRRLLQPEKQHRRSSNHPDHEQLLGREQQRDARRKRVRTAEVDKGEGEEVQVDMEDAAEAMWEKAALQLQQQQPHGEEESQQRLKRLGSVFASHLQEAESSVRANRESAGLLLQRGAPDLFSACWAAVATPLRSGSTRPGERQHQVGSHERALAAAGDANAPGMSWRRWAFGESGSNLPLHSAAVASSAAAAAGTNSAAVAAGDLAGDADIESADFGDMWGPLPEEVSEEQQDYEGLQQNQQKGQLEDATEGIWTSPKAPRRKGGHGVQMDSSISRATAKGRSEGEKAFPYLLRNNSTTLDAPKLCHAATYLVAATADVHELYALHPVSCLYRGLQQQLLLWKRKSAWGFQNPAAAAVAAHSRGPAANRHSKKVSSEPLYGVSAVVSKADGDKQTGQSTEGLAPWQRGGLEGDFTLYTDAELQQQQQQQQDGSKDIRRSGDLLGSGEYVEVLRGIFDSSSMQQRATQTRLTQLPRESEASSTSRLGSSRRASGLSVPSSEASLEALAFGEFPEFDGCGTEFSNDEQQQQQHQRDLNEAHSTAIASLRLRELLQQFALTHPNVSENLLADGVSQQPQQHPRQRQQESTIPLSRLLPRGRVDPRTACCTFSHLLLLHTHGSIKLEQQPQVLSMPSNKPYADLYVHITCQWDRTSATGEAQQPCEEQQSKQQNQQRQEAPDYLGNDEEEQPGQKQHDEHTTRQETLNGMPSNSEEVSNAHESSNTSSSGQQHEDKQQPQQQHQKRIASKPTNTGVRTEKGRAVLRTA